MEKDDLTVVKIRKGTLEIIRKFGQTHGWSPAQFFDKIATVLVCGIDGLMEFDVDELKKLYPYSDVLVSADVRKRVYTLLEKHSGENQK